MYGISNLTRTGSSFLRIRFPFLVQLRATLVAARMTFSSMVTAWITFSSHLTCALYLFGTCGLYPSAQPELVSFQIAELKLINLEC